MKVKELIELLLKLDQEKEILKRDEEYDSCYDIKEINYDADGQYYYIN